MTGIELSVILFGAFLGYWIVGKLIATRPARTTDQPDATGSGGEATNGSSSTDEGPQPWHAILKVSPNATLDEIRHAYKTLLSQYHPDKVATLGEELRNLADRKTKAITSAYREALKLRGSAS